jgi:hypothetical protein
MAGIDLNAGKEEEDSANQEEPPAAIRHISFPDAAVHIHAMVMRCFVHGSAPGLMFKKVR